MFLESLAAPSCLRPLCRCRCRLSRGRCGESTRRRAVDETNSPRTPTEADAGERLREESAEDAREELGEESPSSSRRVAPLSDRRGTRESGIETKGEGDTLEHQHRDGKSARAACSVSARVSAVVCPRSSSGERSSACTCGGRLSSVRVGESSSHCGADCCRRTSCRGRRPNRQSDDARAKSGRHRDTGTRRSVWVRRDVRGRMACARAPPSLRACGAAFAWGVRGGGAKRLRLPTAATARADHRPGQRGGHTTSANEADKWAHHQCAVLHSLPFLGHLVHLAPAPSAALCLPCLASSAACSSTGRCRH